MAPRRRQPGTASSRQCAGFMTAQLTDKHSSKGMGMQLSHFALTVVEDSEWDGAYHWVLLRAEGETHRVEEHSTSKQSFPTPYAAFEAGSAYWRLAMSQEEEDADPVGGVDH